MSNPTLLATMSRDERRVLEDYVAAVRAHYGDRLDDVLVFGSRARGEARDDSDVDVAVILNDPIEDFWREKITLTDLAYDALAEAGLFIQAWAIGKGEWEAPERHYNPRFVEAAKRDAKRIDEVVGGKFGGRRSRRPTKPASCWMQAVLMAPSAVPITPCSMRHAWRLL